MQQVIESLGFDIKLAHSLVVMSLIFVRLAIVVNIVPFLFGRPVPAMPRQIVALLFTVLIYPLVVDQVPAGIETNFFFVMALMAKEVLYGLAIGLAAGMIFYAFDAAGQIIDAQRGASMAQLFSPQTGHQITVFGQFSLQLGIVLFLSLGGHRLFLHSLFESFRLLPIQELPTFGPSYLAMIDMFIVISGQVLLLAAQLAAPIIIAIFVVDIILGVMNRISPAVNVLSLGFVLRGIIGVLIFFISITVFAHQMSLISIESMDNIQKTIRYLTAA